MNAISCDGRVTRGVMILILTSLGLPSAMAAEATSDHTTNKTVELEDFTVSAGPGIRPIEDFATPISLVSQDDILSARSSSLGDLLDSQPGVSSTSFAAGSSRPVIRGFDGNRVRILNTGIELLDASAASPDHAVAVEPLLVDRIEVIRGPSTLLYGSSAIGGAVNIVGRKIPQRRLSSQDREQLELGYRYDSVSEGYSGVAVASAATGDWVLRAGYAKRDAGDYEIPGFAESLPDEGEEESGVLENSFVDQEMCSVGASWFGKGKSRVGFSYSKLDSL